ncbi:MFS-type efflux pump MSMEG_3705-like isoform X2 [Ostrea edulis]|uniref:MFS-type efflux pump MSMEG_3705-like isoform X2 n=1 Tax=Ostrea edulis TaxID=37623 RepID=UPI002095D4E3|nr:MFS-type efflux pump MSMEG_3705-like isoform X2 [Ostrea edulis]
MMDEDRPLLSQPHDDEESDKIMEKKEPEIAKDQEASPWYRTLTPYKLYVLLLLLVTYLLNQLDRYMLAITSKSMAQEIHFGDKACMKNSSFKDRAFEGIKCEDFNLEASCLNATNNETEHICYYDYNGQGFEYQIVAGPAFIVIYTFAGIFISYVAEKFNRKVMLAACLMFWSVMTILTGFVKEYWHLVILRFGLGFGEAGCGPFAVSILTDYFNPETRGFALGIYNWGIYFGYSMSYALGNFISLANINGQGWRWTFFISGIPGLAVGVLMLLTLKEPERKTVKTELSGSAFSRLTMTLKKFFSPSLMLICLAGSIRNASGYVFAYNTQPYFTSIGRKPEEIGKYLSWVPLVGGSFSVLVGGFISDRLVKRLGMYSRILVIGISLLIAAPFAAGTLYFDPPGAYFFQIPTYIFGEMWVGITLAVVVELVPSDIKTTAVAVYLFIISNIGGNANLLVPPLTQHFEDDGYSKSAALRAALYIMYPGPYVYGAVVYLSSLFVIRRDKRRAAKENYEAEVQ